MSDTARPWQLNSKLLAQHALAACDEIQPISIGTLPAPLPESIQQAR